MGGHGFAYSRGSRRAATAEGRRPFGRLLNAASALLGRRPGALRRIRDDASALVRLAREAASGHYRRLPKRSLFAALAAVVYLVNPLDVVPDLLPALGLVDDAAVLAWVARQLRADIAAFLDWERDFGGAIDVTPRPPTHAMGDRR